MAANPATPHNFHIARIGVGVTDLGAAAPFYEALGFTASPPFDLGTTIAAQSETPGSPVVIRIMRRDGVDVELVQHGNVRPPGRPPARRPLNQLGLSHIALAVDDVDRVNEIVRAHGGSVLDFTRSKELGVDAQFCTDPFGARLLLLGSGESAFGPVSPGADGIAVAHFGICVADIDASTAFYASLGFGVGDDTDCGLAFSATAELDGVPLRVRHLREHSYPFVLMQWGPRRDAGVPVRLPLNRTGDLIHFGTHCDDFDAMLDIVTTAGGTVVERTRSQFPPPGLEMPWTGEPHGWVFILDPNGVQIEIVGPRNGSAPSS